MKSYLYRAQRLCVELEKHVLLFDYFTGELPSWDKEKTILVFASHKHQDHFSLRILELRKELSSYTLFFSEMISSSSPTIAPQKRRIRRRCLCNGDEGA